MISALLRVAGLTDLWQPGEALPALAALTAVAGLLMLAAAHMLAAARHEPRSSLARVRTMLRDRTLRTAFLPQRDPDAAGRPRPRAPGLEITATSR